jgi:hypothetical protein
VVAVPGAGPPVQAPPGGWTLFPLAGFAPLPGPGRLDPYNLGVNWPFDYTPGLEGSEKDRPPNWLAGRAGYWGIATTGSIRKTGEWQNLQSSPFLDLDGLITNGERTVNFTATHLDNDANQAALQYYGPNMKFKGDFQTYLHRLNNDPIDNINSNTPLPVPPPLTSGIYKTNLNAGDDNAIRVEQVNAALVTPLNENVKLRVEFFQQRKFGDRQANAVAHCYSAQGIPGRPCHLLSQPQHIDWNTVELTPRVEGRWGPLTIEYARLMRQFSQNDQLVSRDFTGFSPEIIVGTFPYAIVPDTTTQMDQLFLHADLREKTDLYGFGYLGRMDDSFRHITRHLSGFDARLTDRSVKGLLLSAYATGNYQDTTSPTTLLNDETQFLAPADALSRIPLPISYQQTTAGFRSRYLPYFSEPLFSHLAFTGGYEYQVLNRTNAVFTPTMSATTPTLNRLVFDEPKTTTNTVYAGVQQPWTATLDSYARYKILWVADPLYGFRETDGAVNSNLPQQRHIVELGGGWYPAPNFGVSVQQQFDVSWHDANISVVPGNVTHFNESSYSTTGTVWYAPTPKLALMTSLAFLSNWINQNITLGDDYIEPGTPPAPLRAPITLPFFYGGNNVVVTCRADYRWTDTLKAYAGYEYVKGSNAISNSTFVNTPFPDLAQYSAVLVETHRVLAGLDWSPRDKLSLYARYIFYSYDDVHMPSNTGTAHMLLAGLTLVR